MSDKVRKLKERAARLIAKGKVGDALVEYQRCAKLDPRDLSVRQKLAETYTRLGKKHDAIREYQSVAGSYAADGLLLKAIAISKVILNIDPTHTETQRALAELYSQKRGDFASPENEVTLPAAMNAARGRSTSTGTMSRTDVLAALNQVKKKENARVEQVIEVTDDSGIEVLSVENEAPTVQGARVQTNIGEVIALASEEVAPVAPPTIPAGDDIGLDFDVDAAEAVDEVMPAKRGLPPLIPQETFESDLPAIEGQQIGRDLDELPPDEILLEVDDDDDADILELEEATAVKADELPPIPLFSDLPKEAFIVLTERMGFEQLSEGETLFNEGDTGTSMFIVIQGAVKISRTDSSGDEVQLAELSDGAFFGEMSLLSDAPRSATVTAVESTMLFEISKELLGEITTSYPTVTQVMRRFHKNRLLTNLLRTSPIFAPFSATDKKALIKKFKSRPVQPGQLLLTKDKPGDGLYVLLNGRCEVFTSDESGREVVIAELKDGDVFGEMSMLFENYATASVRASSPTIVLRLPKKNFQELIMTHPQVLETLSTLSDARHKFNEELLGG
ncbi:MAG: cyclic nucleotide-binding domain-containing protein [Deltaproteobacteria bacterium]|nr:cyclic nucleotide-binding domain-containing protein [Deltaproteobacteria bacterium]